MCGVPGVFIPSVFYHRYISLLFVVFYISLNRLREPRFVHLNERAINSSLHFCVCPSDYV